MKKVLITGANSYILDKKNFYLRWFILLFFVFAVMTYGIYGPGYNAANFVYAQF